MLKNEPQPGIITVSDVWLAMPNGKLYRYFWAPDWQIVTDALLAEAVGLEHFKSTEKWQIWSETLGVLIPGCQVKCFARSVAPVVSNEFFVYRGQGAAPL